MARFALVLLCFLCAWTAALAPARAAAAGDCTLTASQEMLDAEERAFLALINAHRAANGVGPLTASYRLSRAAQWKSIDMGANSYFAHDDQSRTWTQRIKDCGYPYATWLGENIMAGSSTAQGAFDAWRNSPGHNANMLSANYTAIGIGRAYVAGSPYSWYWTTDFGGVNDGWAFTTDSSVDASPSGPAGDVSVTVEELHGVWLIRAWPRDPAAIGAIEFYVDGALVRRDRTAPYSATWQPRAHHPTPSIVARLIPSDGARARGVTHR